MDLHQTQRFSHIFQKHQSTISYLKCLVSDLLSGSLTRDETKVRRMSSHVHHCCHGLERVLHPLNVSICQFCPNVRISCWLSGTVFCGERSLLALNDLMSGTQRRPGGLMSQLYCTSKVDNSSIMSLIWITVIWTLVF